MWGEFCNNYKLNFSRKKRVNNKSIEFNIRTYQDKEGVFAEVITKEGNHVCVADGKDSYDAIKEVCLVLMDILEWHNEER